MSSLSHLAGKLGGNVGEVGGEDLDEDQVGGVGHLEPGKVGERERM